MSTTRASENAATLARRLLDGDRRALARAISLVEDDRPEGWELVREVYPHTGHAAVYGFTGPPGVGKSTLIGALTKARRATGRTVGVLSVDPSSPFTQGALLGDRIRLTEHFLDAGVFIRSMANRGALGGLSEAALQAALLLDAAGRDDVFVETVGVGQAEIDIIDHADTIVLVLMPGSGDSIQALKAGVMEIPDVIVINKADHPLTDTMVREIRSVLSLANLDRSASDIRARWRVPILKTEAAHGEGIDELVACLDAHRAHILAAGELSERRRRNLRNEVLALATARMRRRLDDEVRGDAAFQGLLDEVVQRRLDPASAAGALLARGEGARATRGLSSLEGAVLGLALECGGDVDELANRLAARLGPAWAVDAEQLRQLLVRLATDALLDARVAQDDDDPDAQSASSAPGGPGAHVAGRTVYGPSERTASALAQWLQTPAPREPTRAEIQAKVAAARAQDAPRLLVALREYERECERLLTLNATFGAPGEAWTALVAGLVRAAGDAQLRAELQWARQARAQIAAHAGRKDDAQ